MYTNVQASQMPSRVLLERLPDGSALVRLTDNVEAVATDEGTAYRYDEVTFTLTADRKETAADIEAAFADWWAYGSEPDEPPATLEERVSNLEDMIMVMLEG